MESGSTAEHQGHVPAAPGRLARWIERTDEPAVRMRFATFLLFFAFTGDLWRYTITWVGYLLIALVLMIGSAVLLTRRHLPRRIDFLPLTLLGFMAWCLVSVVWSHYRLETLGGSAAQLGTALCGLLLAVDLTRLEFVRALGNAMRAIVILSLAFEVFAGIFFPDGILPPAYLLPGVLDELTGLSGTNPDEVPGPFLWTYGDFFSDLPIQGIVGNRNLLAMVALLALITTAAELFDRRLGARRGWIELVLAAYALWRTTSITAFVATAFVLLAAALVLLGRRFERRGRWIMYLVVGVVLATGAVIVILYNNQIFATLFGRSSDMSGRVQIWQAVVGLGQQSPVVGLGWISYWAPWVPMFSHLIVRDDVVYLQAHNAFLDVWMQTGFIGLALFAFAVFNALVRTWWVAIDRPDTPLIEPTRVGGRAHLSATTAVPFLVLVALVVQSMTESRLLLEGNWMLFCALAIYAKLRVQDPALLPRRSIRRRSGPMTSIVDTTRDL